MKHPSYYKAPFSDLHGDDVVFGWNLPYYEMSAVSHILRAGRKPGESRLEALKNAQGCLTRAIEHEERRQGNAHD